MSTQNPHDKFFKETFGNVAVAKNFLHYYLPPSVIQVVNMNTLEPQKDSFINEALQESFSDLLFKADFQEEEGYFYFLFEHKSYPTRDILLQLLQYMLNIWDAKVKKTNDRKLPIVIPLVIYHGKDNWHATKNLGEMIKGYHNLPDELKVYVPNFEYLLYDLSHQSGIETELHTQIKIYKTLATEIAHAADTKKLLDAIFEVVTYATEIWDREKSEAYFKTAMRYVFSAAKTLTENEVNQILNTLEKTYPEGSDIVMTLADIYQEKGKVEGKAEGKVEGKAEGKVAGKLEGIKQVAENLLIKGNTVEYVMEVTGLDEIEVERIKQQRLQ